MEFFSIVAIAAVAGGGIISAFRARRPTRFVMWLTAYLVLVEGLIQFGLVTSWQRLDLSVGWVVILAFSVYNLGNAAVITGRVLRGRLVQARRIVYLGSTLLATAMLLFIWTIRDTAMSWGLVWFVVLIVILFVSMPIGTVLSARRHARTYNS